MTIVEIEALSNGAHRNQIGEFTTIPAGYAVIPDGMKTPNFPFGEVTVKKINEVMTVTKWEPLPIPEPEEIEIPVSPMEQMRADIEYLALMLGVNL